MGEVLAVANQKGGVGKTTTAVNLACFLAAEGHRTLLVDMDPQGNAGSGLGLDPVEGPGGVYSCLIDGRPLDGQVVAGPVPGLEVLPSSTELIGAEIELVGLPARERRLRESLAGLRDDYDFILIDCPPSLGLLTINALVAADGILVPLQAEYYALEGISQVFRAVKMIRRSMNPSLKIRGVVITMFDGRTNLARQVEEEVRQHLTDRVLRTVIPRNVRLAEGPSHGLPILLYDAQSRGAEAYRALALEIANGKA